MLEQGYSQDDILNGFRVDIPTPKTTVGDRMKMAGAALLALLVPALFVITLLFSTAVWLNFTYELLNSSSLNQGMGLVLGVFVLGDLFLLGFIFALLRRLVLIRRGGKSYLEITEQAQPELHAFINHIAHLLNGPKPKSVKLDAEVGLVLRPACLRDSLSGTGPEVVIGLPLLYGLSARQLSGVIAHAYAGYSRDARLLGYTVLSSMDRWLFTQTGLSRNTQNSTEFSGGKLPFIDRLFKPFDVLVQGSFYLIYRVIGAVTFGISRKVDMVGDLFSARVAGSTEFRSTQFRLRSLHYGQSHANQELINSWRTKKLPDNFPALVVDHADTLQLSLRPRLIQEMEELVTPLTRSRIVDLGRIINVEHTQEEGACFLLGSAITLLREPAQVSKAVTLSHYRHLGIQHPDVYTSQKVQSIQKAELEKAKRRKIYRGLESSGRVIRLDDFERYGVQAEESLLHDLNHLTEKLCSNESVVRHLSETFREYEFRKNLLSTRKVLEECKGSSKDSKEIEVQWLTLIKEQSEYKNDLSSHESDFSRRAAIGFALAVNSSALHQQLQMTQAEFHSHLLKMVDALNFLQRCFESIQRLRGYTQVLGQILVETDLDNKAQERVSEMSHRYQKYILIEMEALMKVLGGVAYPLGGIGFSNPQQESGLLTIGDVVQMEVADLDSASSCPEAGHRVANAVCQYLENFNEQIQQRIASILFAVDEIYQKDSVSEPK